MNHVILDWTEVPLQQRQILTVVGGRAFIAGGAARATLLGSDAPTPSDIDLFQVTTITHDVLREDLERIGYVHVNESVNATTLKSTNLKDALPVQLIRPHRNATIKMYGPPDVVLENFDFTINQVAIQALPTHNPKYTLYYHVLCTDEFMLDYAARLIRISHMNNPIAVAYRMIKYGNKGFAVPMSEMAKCFRAWSEMSKESRGRVEDLLDRFEDGTLTVSETNLLYELMLS